MNKCDSPVNTPPANLQLKPFRREWQQPACALILAGLQERWGTLKPGLPENQPRNHGNLAIRKGLLPKQGILCISLYPGRLLYAEEAVLIADKNSV